MNELQQEIKKIMLENKALREKLRKLENDVLFKRWQLGWIPFKVVEKQLPEETVND